VKDVLKKPDGGLMQPYPLEAQLEKLAGVARAAVVACNQHPCGIAVIELAAGMRQRQWQPEVERILKEEGVPRMNVIFMPSLPVDGRHNTKIDRPLLRTRLETKPLWKRLIGAPHRIGLQPHEPEEPDEMEAVSKVRASVSAGLNASASAGGKLRHAKRPQGALSPESEFKPMAVDVGGVRKGIRLVVTLVADLTTDDWDRIFKQGEKVLTSTAGLRESIERRQRIAIWWTAENELVGLTTVDLHREKFKGRQVVSIYTGNVWLAPSARNATLLPQLGFLCAKECYKRWPLTCWMGGIYWFFGAASFMSYRFACRNFPVVYPSRQRKTPKWQLEYMCHLGKKIYLKDIDPEKLVDYKEGGHRAFKELQSGDVDRSDPDVDYFITRNPGFKHGDTLLSLVPLTPKQLVGMVLKQRAKKKKIITEAKAKEKAYRQDEKRIEMEARRTERDRATSVRASFNGGSTPKPRTPRPSSAAMTRHSVYDPMRGTGLD